MHIIVYNIDSSMLLLMFVLSFSSVSSLLSSLSLSLPSLQVVVVNDSDDDDDEVNPSIPSLMDMK